MADLCYNCAVNFPAEIKKAEEKGYHEGLLTATREASKCTNIVTPDNASPEFKKIMNEMGIWEKGEEMITNQRRYEIIQACREIIASPNFTDKAKEEATNKIAEMNCGLMFIKREKK